MLGANVGAGWLGASDLDVEDTYAWVVDEPFDQRSTLWDGGEPNNGGTFSSNEDCLGIRDSGRWNDAECDLQFPYVCER